MPTGSAMLGLAHLQAMLNLPSHIGVTATLSVSFKAPCQADQVRSPPRLVDIPPPYHTKGHCRSDPQLRLDVAPRTPSPTRVDPG